MNRDLKEGQIPETSSTPEWTFAPGMLYPCRLEAIEADAQAFFKNACSAQTFAQFKIVWSRERFGLIH